ncbi:terpene synthase family protein [Kitasatospora aureofaciens]|uniref:terpene synthase family protein n=1 Tax=Kitasatospora aureofaciens TaxID=1894 RepID=UPI001C455A76|nr:terpene synthase family protein [Kitasatospora aureofaciens]MBV6703033.1 terpene synthase family protein [Kitasatospora aureofaciens]
MGADQAQHLLDAVVEVACRTEIPPDLAATDSWTELCAASSDITAWCNDLYSLARERANAEPTNYVTVLRHALTCTEHAAIEQVRTHITRRLQDLDNAGHAFLAEAHRREPGAHLEYLHRVVRIICDMPGTHLGWMLASGRYQ